MRRNKAMAIILTMMLVGAGLLVFPVSFVGADPVYKKVLGIVDQNSTTLVRAYDPGPNNGRTYYYIQNRTNEGNGTDPITIFGGFDVYDPEIYTNISDWKVGDQCINVVSRDYGTYGVDHAGYVAFMNTTLTPVVGTDVAPTTELLKIPTPTMDDNGSNYVEISWPAITDPYGLVAGYVVYRSDFNGTVSGDAEWTLVSGDKNSPVIGTTFNDTTAVGGSTYYYSLRISFIGYTFDNPANVDNYECAYFGEGSGMMETPPAVATIDYIRITTDIGFEGPVDLGVGQSIMLYARGYNATLGYVGLVEVDWSRLPVEGSLDTPTGQTSTYTAGMNGAAVTVTGTNASYGSDDFIVNILPPTVDYIAITDGAGGANLTGGPVPVGFQEWGTCSGYNVTAGYIGTFSAAWTVEGGGATDLGITPDVTHGIDVGLTDVTVWLNASFGGFTDSVQYTVLTATVDYIDITFDPLGMNPLPGGSVPVGFQEWGFATAHNFTAGFLNLVMADWTVEGPTASDLGGTPDVTHGIDVGLTDVTVWLNASWGGFTDSVAYNVLTPTIDSINITEDVLGVIELLGGSVPVGFQEWGYAAGYNATSGFVSLVSAVWTVEGGSATPLGSTPDTTHGIDVGLTDVTVYLNASFGGFTDSVQYTVLTPTVDSIDITEDDLGINPLTGGLVISPFTQWGNCSAYNSTAGFLYLVSAVWTVQGGDATDLGSSPDFTHGIDVGTIAGFVWLNASFGGFTDSVQYEISSWTIDYIVITSDAAGQIPILDQFPPVGFQEWGYAAAWNNTFGFISLVSATWGVSGGGATDLGTSPNNFHGIDVGLTGGVTVFLTATFGGFTDNVQYDVLPPTVDSIDITSDVLGNNPVQDKTVVVGFQEWGYAAGYNVTSGFVSLVSAGWVVAGGSSSALGSTPDTTHGVDVGLTGATVTLTANFGGFSDTVTYTVLSPTVDSINITFDALGVTELLGGLVPVGFQEWGYAAGYNNTSGFVQLVSADWTAEVPAVGLLGPTPGSSNGIDVGLTGSVSVWLNASWGGFTDSVQYDIIPPTVDYIDITEDIFGVTPLADKSVPVGFQEWGYAAGYNNTSNFVSLVSADWTVQEGLATPLGSTPDTTHGIDVGTIAWIVYLNATFGGSTDSVVYTILPPTIDYIDITVDNLGVTPVTDKSVGVAFQEWGYAAGYNTTSDFVQLVAGNWAIGGTASLLSITPAQQNGIDVGMTSGTVWLNLSWGGFTDSVQYTVLPQTIDYITIMDAAGGVGNAIYFDWPNPVSFTLYAVADTDQFWAAGFNATTGNYVSDVSVTWSSLDTLGFPDTFNGTVTAGPSISTNFIANSDHGGALIVKAENIGLSLANTTNFLIIIPPTADDLKIRDAPNDGGNVVSTATYIVSDSDTFYAAGYNDTAGYIGDVDADWTIDAPLVGSVVAGPAGSTTFDALTAGTCTVTATNATTTTSNSTGILTVDPGTLTIDSIKIMDAAGGLGNEVGAMTYAVYDTDFFYAAGFNGTTYVDDVTATWQSSDSLIGAMDAALPPPTFTAQLVASDSTCVVTATYNAMTDDTGTLTVLAPVVDYIQIQNAPDGGGTVIGDRTFSVEEVDQFYASAYNLTVGYLREIEVDWTISPATGVGTIDASGVLTNFTALEVSSDTTCTVTATYGTLTNVTGTITVLEPRVDEIIIRTAPDEGGIIFDSPITMDISDTGTYYAAGYNETVGYVEDLAGASWGVTNSIATLSDTSGDTTTITAVLAGTGRLTVSALGLTNESALITVNAEPVDDPPSQLPAPEINIIGRKAIITFDPIAGETDIDIFIIQRAKSSDGPWTNVTVLNEDEWAHTDKDLDPDTKYYYRVIAVDNAGQESPPSQWTAATTDPVDEFPWLLLILLLIIVIVVILLLVYMMSKKKKGEEEMPPGAVAPGAEATEEAPGEEYAAEEEYAPEGEYEEGVEYEEEYTPEETIEEEPQTDEGGYEEEIEYEEEPETPSTPPPPPPPPPA
jgi:hypothetical protein